MGQQQATKPEGQQPGQELQPVSARFVSEVERQFAAIMGSSIQLTEHQRILVQHLFLKCDSQLAEFDKKRLAGPKPNEKTPYEWANVNLQKLAIDAVHRVNLGLDALIANHIHPVPYMNGKTKKYDLDLRIGYKGKDYCRRELAVEKPVDVTYRLVHETDEFEPIFKDAGNEKDFFRHKITNAFNRGAVVGGFGYIEYSDPHRNKLVLVDQRAFKKAEDSAKTGDFWGEGKYRQEMQLKTVVHRTTEQIPLDPKKVNQIASLKYVEGQEAEHQLAAEIAENANCEIIDMDETVEEETGEVTETSDEPGQQKAPF